MDKLQTPVRKLSGVGEARSAAYAKLGIRTLEDLLYHFPRAYEHRGDIRLLAEAPDGVKSALMLTIATEPKRVMIRRGMVLLKFRAFDESGVAEITYFNQDYLRDKFPVGSEFRFWGRVERKGKMYSLSSPEYEPVTDEVELRTLVPVYKKTDGITSKQLMQNIASAQSIALSGDCMDILPDDIRRENKLCTLEYALKNIHNPSDFKSLAAAKRRLIFDELFLYAIGITVAHKKARECGSPVCKVNDISDFLKALPYDLTGAQMRTVQDIMSDMSNNIPMSRIVVGDVGCGKTVCAAAAIYVAVKSGYQAAFMVPTEILARQHYNDLYKLMKDLGISCELLIGATQAAAKKRIKSALNAEKKEDRIDVVIGTQALLTEDVKFSRMGLVITDEQHRFGVSQKATLSDKSDRAHTLVMSATPIPRSMALVMYGDLDISKIDEMPPGRQRVDTFAVNESYRERLNGFIKKQIDLGGQVYIVCPAVEEIEEEENELELSEVLCHWEEKYDEGMRCAERKLPLKAAVTYAEELSKTFPQYNVGFVHGKLKSKEKEAVMKAFASGDINILVSTTVIEVGVNVPNASLMIVENAERFGLSQLHQLRGRVGRGSRKSYCILVSEKAREQGAPVNDESPAEKRLDIMKTTYDGFTIAEKDLAMRGPGDFLKGSDEDRIRQSGGVRFRLADMCNDAGTMNLAFKEARILTDSDPDLSEHPKIKKLMEDMFSLDRAGIN